MNDEILQRLNILKNNIQHSWVKFSEKDFDKARQKMINLANVVQEKMHIGSTHLPSPHNMHLDNYHYESHRMDDASLDFQSPNKRILNEKELH